MSHSTAPPEELSLELLAAHCAEQTERFFRKLVAQETFCFELLRRAILSRSQAAWEHLYAQYRTLVAGWVQQHPTFAACDEEVDFFVNGAFARVGRWCTPDRFANFAGLPQWLASLKACVHSEIIDYQRQRASHSQPLEWHEESVTLTTAPPDATHAHSALRAELWQLLQERLQSEQERLLVTEAFVNGYKSREICALHPAIFADIQEVYRVKDNLLRRLRRDPALRRLFADFIE